MLQWGDKMSCYWLLVDTAARANCVLHKACDGAFPGVIAWLMRQSNVMYAAGGCWHMRRTYNLALRV